MRSVPSRRISTSRPSIEALQPNELPQIGLPLEFRVAGTGYERRYTSIRRYGARLSAVRLIPEPMNPVDVNAIGIHMRWLNDSGKEVWDQIGYVPAELSSLIGPLIRGGEWAIKNAFIRRVDASPELDAPRVTIRLEGDDLRNGLPS